MADTHLSQPGLAHTIASPLRPQRAPVIYEGVSRAVPDRAPPAIAEVTRYTPSERSQPVTYSFKPNNQPQRQLSPEYTTSQGNVFELQLAKNTQASMQTPPKARYTLEHNEHSALKVFKQIANNGENRQQKYQQVNLFV